METRERKWQPYKNEKDAIIPLIPKACGDERAAVELFEQMRWGSDPACVKCGSTDVYQMRDSVTGDRQANFRWRCRDCKKQYTVRTGHVMEDSALPLTVWAMAFWQATASKKGCSAKQLERMTGISYKSALFVLHRIRWGMVETDGAPLTGAVEVDETFVGGKPRKLSKQQREKIIAEEGALPKPTRGRGRGHHTPIVAVAERSTKKVRTRVTADVTAPVLRAACNEMIRNTKAVLYTDELAAYKGMGKEYAGHETVCHSAFEYARGPVHVNTLENFFSRFERAMFGIWHNVSRVHLHRYATHIEFLHNNRECTDGVRFGIAVRSADGKRLTRRALP
ncbi:MAG TPA: IS1595 family transposase [Longimicrobium sp.]|nr:IS1595 family transposase [Longimicrobium sp.]